MTTALTGTPLGALAPIGLDELLDRALLLTRVDRKYLVPLGTLRALLGHLPPGTRVLEIDGARDFAYTSLYFDTPDLVSYLLTARRRRRRFKIRTRLYEESGECWLEVKTRGPRGSTVKHRLPHDPAHFGALAPGRHFADAVLAEQGVAEAPRLPLAPTLSTRYRRTTLYLQDTGSRATIDTELTWDDGGKALRLPGLAVVETKTGSAASPVDRLLWRGGFRPVRISKYGTGLAALRPHLPATAWRRTLRRDLLPGAVHTAPVLHDLLKNRGAHPCAGKAARSGNPQEAGRATESWSTCSPRSPSS
ncbi:polyphosphate polymerase domain-containing protein [Streptomyces hoynatensis]|uniref:Polyphosphate polymerase domain-containing protein n=1 Tax=Streptomyces hoynatensis TaxID=1141874 RepID=A0A3A9YVJ0_9ACTN|nr:polyphosphate polymerase domain-containing protein [Streptomyces hoynatensis]RKN40063.1 polyphosphate polymerase domain-containing protein [Streptomyces hoynatensis]